MRDSEYESKLADKEKALVDVKEEMTKQVEEVKATVASETIKIVANQGVNIPLDTNTNDMVMTKEKALSILKTIKDKKEQQEFYQKHYELLSK